MEIFSYHEGLGKWIEIANVRLFLFFYRDKADSWTVWYLPSRDVGTYGNTKECKSVGLGDEL